VEKKNKRWKVPLVRETGWLSIIPQLLFMGLLIFLYYPLGIKECLLFGGLTYLVISFTIRGTFTINHRRGIKNCHEQNYTEAIQFFQKSCDFFEKHKWVDKYRYITLLSSSKYYYREMGLCNIAFCYTQIEEAEKAEYYYNIVLQEFPDNNLAIAALNFINTIKSKNENQ